MSLLKNICLSLAFTLILSSLANSEPEIKTMRLSPVPGMIRAELKYGTVPPDCAGALVLCPGYNGDGETLIREKGWRDFAKKHRLVLVGLSFASNTDDLSAKNRRGYYYAENGSGHLLLSGLRKIIGKDLPIAIFGFSGGAHFTHRFVYQFPEKIKVWAAYGFGWYDDAPESPTIKPPGVFACGLKDSRFDATLSAFLSARRAQWPVCWLGIPENGHITDARAIALIRNYFDAVFLMKKETLGIWTYARHWGLDGFWVKAWFPNEKTLNDWYAF